MSQTLSKLREKPEHHRRRIAFMASSGVMVVIVAIWVTTFSVRFPQLSNAGSNEAAAAAALNDQSANSVDSVKNNFADGYNSINQALNQNGNSQTASVS